MISRELVKGLVDEVLVDDMFLVKIDISSSNAITVIVDSMTGVTVEQIVKVSRQVEHNLDRENEDFSLEVASPGLTEPFTVFRQYEKYINKSVEVVLTSGEKLEGTLLTAVEGDKITLEVSKRERVEGKKKKILVTTQHEVSFDDLKSAKCVISFK